MAKALAISNLTENKSISDDVIVEAYILNFTKQQLCVLNRLKYYHNIPISKQELASSLVHQKREGSFGKKNWRFVNNRKYAESTKQMKQQDNERERVRKNEEYSKSFEAKGGYERKDKYIYHECFECGYKTEPIPLVRAQSRICPKCKGHPEDEDGYDVATMIAYEDIEKTMALRKKERLENLFSKHPDMSEELKNHYKNKFGAESSKPHSVTISRSSNSEKKLMAVFEDSDDKKIKTTHFGQRGASDYTKHGEKERMKRYLERHGGGTTTSTKEDWNDPKTAGSLSRWVLWNKPNLKSSFNDYKSRFGLKGSLNVSKSAEIDRFNAFSINVDSTRPNRMNHKGLMIEGDLYCSCGCRGNLEKHDDYKEYQYDDLFEPFIKHLDKEYIKKTWQGLRFYDIKVRMRKPYKKGLINIYFLIEGRKNTRYVNSIVDSIKRRILTHEMGLYETSGYYNYEGNSMQFRVIELSKVPIQIIAPYLPEERGKYISTLSFNSESSEKEQAKKILKALNDAGYDSLFVGGAVRDKFLGLEPKDYDIGTSATPSQVANVINNLSGFTYVLGPEGDRAQRALTSLINPEVGEQIEVTTYRKEMYGKDRADIDATPAKTFKEDAARRDLTINSMGETIDGEIIDYFGGKEDLENKKIRTVGNPNERFQEDPLRIIRAIRFATKYNFSIDKETYAAIKKNKDLVKDLSSKRRRDEIGKVLVQPNGYKMLMETGILPALMPEFRNMTDYHHKLDYHPEGNLYNHYIEAFKKFTTIPNRTELGAWALLFHDIAKPQTANWDEEGGYHTFYGHDKQGGLLVLENYNNTKGPFEFSKKELQKIAWTTDNHLGKFWDMKKPTKVAKMRNDDNYPLLVQVVTGDTMGIRRGGDEELASRLIEIDEITDKINEQKLKTGNRPKDFARKVIQELNVKNQEISIALNEIEELVSTGQVSSYDEALRVLKSKRQSKNAEPKHLLTGLGGNTSMGAEGKLLEANNSPYYLKTVTFEKEYAFKKNKSRGFVGGHPDGGLNSSEIFIREGILTSREDAMADLDKTMEVIDNLIVSHPYEFYLWVSYDNKQSQRMTEGNQKYVWTNHTINGYRFHDAIGTWYVEYKQLNKLGS
jgi:tRNA nucleotidyltransferase (CCA-adding enzyme)